MSKKIPWNKGKKGLQVVWNKNLKGIHLSPSSEFKKGVSTWIKGKTHSEETKRKISETRLKGFLDGRIKPLNKGMKRPEMTGSNHPMFGKHHTDKSKELNRLAHLGKHLSPLTEFKKGSSGFTGTHSEESKKKRTLNRACQ